jgi:imidazolonepropionase-like amidohydrolase
VNRLVLFLALMIIGGPACARTTAITGATVWTMTGDAPVENATILIERGRIVSVKAKGAVPAGALEIPADHRVVTPALVNAATQIGLGEVGGIDEEQRGHVESGPLGAAFDVSFGFDAEDQAVRQARADGVGWALIYPDASGLAPFDGMAAIAQLGQADARVLRPRAAMLVTVGGASARRVGGSTAAAWQLIRNALDETRAYRPASSPGTPRDQLLNHLNANALKPMLAGTMPLIVECNRLADIRQAIALARDYRLKLILFGGAEAWAAARELAESHIPVILDPLATLPDSYDALGARPENAAFLHRAGVPIAFSVSAQGIYRSWDAGPSLREGAGLAVASGLPYPAALAAITSSSARVIGLSPSAGTLAPGAAADLVIWDGDPLEPSSAPVLVMSGGEKVSPVTRQTLLRDRYAPHRP